MSLKNANKVISFAKEVNDGFQTVDVDHQSDNKKQIHTIGEGVEIDMGAAKEMMNENS